MVASPGRPQQFLRRVQNRPALRRRSQLAVFAQLLLVAIGIAVGGGIAYLGTDYVTHNRLFRLHRLLLDRVPAELRPPVRSQLQGVLEVNLLTADLTPFQQRIERLPLVRTVHLRRVLPDALEVELDLRQPWGVLQATDGEFLVSDNGVIVGPVDGPTSTLPRLRVPLPLHQAWTTHHRLPDAPAARAFPDAVRIVEWLQRTRPAEIDPSREIWLTPQGVAVTLSRPPVRLLLGDARELPLKIQNLRALLAGAPVPPGSTVDVRFRDMVVVRPAESDDQPTPQE